MAEVDKRRTNDSLAATEENDMVNRGGDGNLEESKW
jgi:hypothetical protein